jgi:TetR/AcrR family transcriptional regulator, cholesterol catabolism regulator
VPNTANSNRREQRRQKSRDGSDARYRDILRAGALVFRENGYANSTLQDVADAVGLNRATLYYYIGTKEELLAEILNEPLLEMTRRLQRLGRSRESPPELLRHAIVLQFEAFERCYPEMFVFLAEQLHNLSGEGLLRANASEYGDLLTRIIVRGQRRGEFRKDVDPRVAMLGVVGMANWVHRWYRLDGPFSLRAIGDQFATMAVEGLIERAPRDRGAREQSVGSTDRHRANGTRPGPASD